MDRIKSRFRFIPTMLYLMLALGIVGCARQPEYAPPLLSGSDVAIEVSKLQEGIPLFLTHDHRGKKISFFVVKIDNTVLSFLDACNACYPHKRGYKYDHGMIVCLYCKEKYLINEIAAGSGNCYPIKLPGRIQAGRYLIAVLSLEKNANKF